VIAALWSRLAGLLTARFLGRALACSVGFAGSGAGFAAGAKELLLAEAELGAQGLVLGTEFHLTGECQFVHALPVGGLAEGLELLGKARTDRARTFRQGRGGADSGSGGDWQGNALRWRDDYGGLVRAAHAARCSPSP
jgi:hypothetical protein